MQQREQLGPGAHEIPPDLGRASQNESPQRFRLLSISEVINRPPRPYLVRGILGRGELAMMFGPPASGKSFVAISLALSLATGEEWYGRAVHAGPVVYVVAEGAGGFGQRLKVWVQAKKLDPVLPLFTVEEPVQFMREGDVGAFIEALNRLEQTPVLVVIDTLARSLDGGDENVARDMGRLIAGCDQIRRETGASVLLVHHSGKNSDAERGSSALRGAVDTALAVYRSKGGEVVLSCSKQKDEAAFESLTFELKVVDLGFGEDGQPVSSCVLSPKWGGTEGGESHGGLGQASSTMCQVLRDSFFENVAASGEWRAASTVSKTSFFRHLRPLVEKGYVDRFSFRGHDRFRVGQRYLDEFGLTVPPSPTQSQASSGTSPTPPPPLEGEVGGTGTGTGTQAEIQTSFPHVKKSRTCDA